MKAIAWILLLALAWTAVSGSFTAEQLLVGVVLGALVLSIIRPTRVHPARRVGKLLFFAGFFVVELVVANLRIARDVLSPRPDISPGVVAIPLEPASDVQITALANLLALTPGTLPIDVSQDRRVLYIHDMYAADPELVRAMTKDGFERRILELDK